MSNFMLTCVSLVLHITEGAKVCILPIKEFETENMIILRSLVCASIYTIFLPRTLASNGKRRQQLQKKRKNQPKGIKRSVEDANHFWELDYPEMVDNITCQPANITSQVPGGLKNMRSPAGTGVFVTGTSEINLNPDLAIECPCNPTRCTTGFSVSFLIKVTGPESCFNHYSFLFGNIVTQPLEQITDYIGFAVGMRTKYFEIVVVSDNFVCKGTLTWYRRNVWTHVAFSWKDPASSDSGLKVFNDASKSDLQKSCDLELRDRRPPRQTISLGSSTQSLLLSVEMDVLAIWNKRLSNSKLNAPWRHIQDNSRIPIVVDFNVVLLDLPWEPSLSDTESDEHEHLIEEFTEQLTNLNNSVKGIILGANVSGLRQLSDGKVTAKMSFNFYRSEWQTLLQSQETFENGTVLNSRIEILSCSATDESPSVGPNITNAFNLSSNSLFVSWLHSIPPNSYVGVLTGYRVLWSEQAGSKNKKSRDLGLDADNFTITGLKAYWLYKVQVAGRTNGGSGTTNDRYVRTDEDVPSAGPDNLTVTVINSTSLLVEWKNVDPCCRNGVTRGYRVFLKDQNQQNIIANLMLIETVFSIGFHDLFPYHGYEVSVTAFNVKGIGPASTNVSLTGEGGNKVLKPVFADRLAKVHFIIKFGCNARCYWLKGHAL